jgi:hypothetical protein
MRNIHVPLELPARAPLAVDADCDVGLVSDGFGPVEFNIASRNTRRVWMQVIRDVQAHAIDGEVD